MKQAIILLLAVLLGGCGSAGAPAESASPVQVSQKTTYYDIGGNTENEIRTELNQKGVIWTDGGRYDALTTWSLSWTYNTKCSDMCIVDNFKVNVSISFIYPRWIPPAAVSPDLVSKWNAYMANLVDHELGHRDIAVAAGTDLVNAALSLPAEAYRPDLERKLAELTQQKMNAMTGDEAAYDVLTRHGATQGAVFP